MQLHFRQYGEDNGGRLPVVLLHGMLGSSANWHGIAKRLEQERYRVIVPDLRNHGRSPHEEGMSYPLMAGDVVRMLDLLEIEDAVMVGHSMGAKTAMWMALNYPGRIDRLVAVDMAPVTSPNRFEAIFDALMSLDIARVDSRQEVEEHLAQSLDNPTLRQYLTQNLVRDDNGWRWRVNIPVLASSIDAILGFPATESGVQFQGETLFLYGGESDYVTSDAAAVIAALFPFSRLRAVAGAGHWVYSERPDEFYTALLAFLR